MGIGRCELRPRAREKRGKEMGIGSRGDAARASSPGGAGRNEGVGGDARASLGLQGGESGPWATGGWAWEVQEAGLAVSGPEVKRAGLSLLYIIL